jgi:oxygen-independent coproporphyrinogen-3 oxidase
MAGIYIHIPFCKQACHYCDFYFSTNTAKRTDLIYALGREMELQKNYLSGEELNTIYFGGGTPSLLSPEEIGVILNDIHRAFTVAPSPEITLEANPDDLVFAKLLSFKSIGINRLSIGIQSFDDDILKFLNRAHDAGMAAKSYEDARAASFENISIDLMYAIPGQDQKVWKKNIQKAISLNPEHISSYSLTIENKTVFGKWAAQKKITAPDEDISAAELIILIDELEQAGFEHYEVSNFSRPSFMSKHNSNYWKGEKYLGLGPSAHSFNGTSRQSNISNNQLYIAAIQSERVPATVEILSREDKINDWLLTGLRTAWGTNLTDLLKSHQYDLLQMHGPYIKQLIDSNLAVVTDQSLILTKSGRLLADKIAADLFATDYSSKR